MDSLTDFYSLHPFWTWIAVGAALLAIEVAIGSGYLLWAAAAAGLVALFAVTGMSPGLAVELGLFAVLTIVSALVARRFFPPAPEEGPDINDPNLRLVGRHGDVVGAFTAGQGRVFVEGKEWAAQSADALAAGDRVEVVSIADGASLTVRRVPA
jgi:inner membrane protein